MLESQIQRAISDWLDLHGFFWRRMPMGGVRQAGAGFKKNPMKGFPDLWGLFPSGRMYAIEVKTKTGRMSKEQAIWKYDLTRLGAVYIEARSIDDVASAMAEVVPWKFSNKQ